MKKETLFLLVLSAIVSLYSCGNNKAASSTEETKPSITEEAATETSTVEIETANSAPKNYVHGEDGYFNLLEEYPEIKLKEQIGGTCWLFTEESSKRYENKRRFYTPFDLRRARGGWRRPKTCKFQ